MSTKKITASIVIRYARDAVLPQLPEKSHEVRNAVADLICKNSEKYGVSLPICYVELRFEAVDTNGYQYDDLMLEVEVDSYDGMQDVKSVAEKLLSTWLEIFVGNTSFGVRMKYRDAAHVSGNFKN